MTDTPYRILYIEDDVALGRLLQRRLQEKNYQVTVLTTAQEGIAEVRKGNNYDIILLDYFLSDLEGLEVLEALQPLEERPPIILLTASGDEGIAVKAVYAGAADYVVKDVGLAYIDLLPMVMLSAHIRYRLSKENRQQREELRLAWERADSGNRAKSDFLSAISHEIRTPLNVIIGATDLLEKTTLDPKQDTLVKTLKSNASLLLALVNDTLDLNKIEAGAMTLEQIVFKASDIIFAMESLFSVALKQKNLQFVTNDETKEAIWQGDLLRIKQVIINLMSNAIKFTVKGTITLDAKIGADNSLELTVTDTGIGIPEAKHQAIFDSFSQADQSTTREYGGTGLGLALASGISKLMDGKLSLKSDVGKGSSFTVSLPLKRLDGVCEVIPMRPAKENLSEENTGQAPQAANKNILLVEDYPANALVAEMMLKDMGYQVTWASSGKQAVVEVENASEPFCVILMDIQMQGMDGYMTTKEIRALEKTKDWRQPIIGVTAHALQDEVERCRRAGMNDYMSKPINWGLMEKKLAAL